MQNQLPKLVPLIGPRRLQYTNNQLAVACSMSIIVLTIIFVTVVLCVRVTVATISFLHKAMVCKPVCIPLSATPWFPTTSHPSPLYESLYCSKKLSKTVGNSSSLLIQPLQYLNSYSSVENFIHVDLCFHRLIGINT